MLLYSNYGYTLSGGAYSVRVPSVTQPNDCASWGIQFFNLNWAGNWNETLRVWAYGYYNVSVQNNSKIFVPSSVEFIHTIHADISSYSTEIDTTTLATWLFGGNGGSTQQSSQVGWEENSAPAGDSLLVDTLYWTTGTGSFNAIGDRQVSLVSLTHYLQTGASFNLNGWSDWQTTQPSTGSCSKFDSSTLSYTLTLSGSVMVSSGYDSDLGVSIGPFSASVPVQNTLQSTSGNTTTVQFTMTNPNYPGYAYFLVNTEGGSSPSSSSAIVAHVWYVSSC